MTIEASQKSPVELDNSNDTGFDCLVERELLSKDSTISLFNTESLERQ